jgi:two-component sensor histidine kinase
LATNATKYGALSHPAGWVDVAWSAAKAPHGRRVRVAWREHGGPPVSPPGREGFGSRILRAGLGGRARSKTTLDFQPDGLQWTVSFEVSDDEISPARTIPSLDDDG